MTTTKLLNIEAYRSDEEVLRAFASIHPDTTVLDISNSHLGNREASVLKTAFSCIPKKVKTVHAGRNNLGNVLADDFLTSLSGFPETIEELHLDTNTLFY